MRINSWTIFLSALVGVFLVGCASAPTDCATSKPTDIPVKQVVIIRHAERYYLNIPQHSDWDPLTDEGMLRADALPAELERLDLVPDRIFATRAERTQQTVRPLSQQLGIPVDATLPSKVPVDQIWCHVGAKVKPGERILIVTHHENISTLAEKIGVQLNDISEESIADRNDYLIVVTKRDGGFWQAVLTRYGDPTRPKAMTGAMAATTSASAENQRDRSVGN